MMHFFFKGFNFFRTEVTTKKYSFGTLTSKHFYSNKKFLSDVFKNNNKRKVKKNCFRKTKVDVINEIAKENGARGVFYTKNDLLQVGENSPFRNVDPKAFTIFKNPIILEQPVKTEKEEYLVSERSEHIIAKGALNEIDGYPCVTNGLEYREAEDQLAGIYLPKVSEFHPASLDYFRSFIRKEDDFTYEEAFIFFYNKHCVFGDPIFPKRTGLSIHMFKRLRNKKKV